MSRTIPKKMAISTTWNPWFSSWMSQNWLLRQRRWKRRRKRGRSNQKRGYQQSPWKTSAHEPVWQCSRMLRISCWPGVAGSVQVMFMDVNPVWVLFISHDHGRSSYFKIVDLPYYPVSSSALDVLFWSASRQAGTWHRWEQANHTYQAHCGPEWWAGSLWRDHPLDVDPAAGGHRGHQIISSIFLLITHWGTTTSPTIQVN